jgi:hypothetical protein
MDYGAYASFLDTPFLAYSCELPMQREWKSKFDLQSITQKAANVRVNMSDRVVCKSPVPVPGRTIIQFV